MELKDYLEQLKRDFDSSQSPQWYDEQTKACLNHISYEIKIGRYTWEEFRMYVDGNFGQGDFAWGCLQYVRQNI